MCIITLMRRRPRPVTLDNPEVYPYYTEKGPNETFMRGFHAVMDNLFAPRAAYLPGSEEIIDRHLHQARNSILALGHVSWFDPCNLAALLRQEKPLQPIIGNVVIPGNAPYFNKPVIGSIISTGGAIPTFRVKDVFGGEEIVGDSAIEDRRRAAGRKLVEITIGNYKRGRNVAYFAEGTRNRGDCSQIQEIKGGIVKLANHVNETNETMMICMSPYYGEGEFAKRRWRDHRTPTVGIGHIAIGAGMGINAEDIRNQMQDCLDLAISEHPS